VGHPYVLVEFNLWHPGPVGGLHNAPPVGWGLFPGLAARPVKFPTAFNFTLDKPLGVLWTIGPGPPTLFHS